MREKQTVHHFRRLGIELRIDPRVVLETAEIGLTKAAE